RAMGLKLSAPEVAALEAQTEGWIAGLQLAALSLQGQADTAQFISQFSGSHRYILDYLVDEVLVQQPEDVQSFLMQVSCLDRMCAGVVEAVTGTRAAQERLEALEHANLFVIALDGTRQWFRLHRLFAELLQSRLRQLQPDRLPELHRRASLWFRQNGFA